VSSAIESQKIIEEKCRIKREYANDIGSLENSLEEEQELRVSLDEKLESIEESHNEIISKLTKERDLALAKLSSPIAHDNDACATNSTSCESSILEENVELRVNLNC
jgi:septal ring factor EnvC (AmiA/AmiB activator)